MINEQINNSNEDFHLHTQNINLPYEILSILRENGLYSCKQYKVTFLYLGRNFDILNVYMLFDYDDKNEQAVTKIIKNLCRDLLIKKCCFFGNHCVANICNKLNSIGIKSRIMDYKHKYYLMSNERYTAFVEDMVKNLRIGTKTTPVFNCITFSLISTDGAIHLGIDIMYHLSCNPFDILYLVPLLTAFVKKHRQQINDLNFVFTINNYICKENQLNGISFEEIINKFKEQRMDSHQNKIYQNVLFIQECINNMSGVEIKEMNYCSFGDQNLLPFVNFEEVFHGIGVSNFSFFLEHSVDRIYVVGKTLFIYYDDGLMSFFYYGIDKMLQYAKTRNFEIKDVHILFNINTIECSRELVHNNERIKAKHPGINIYAVDCRFFGFRNKIYIHPWSKNYRETSVISQEYHNIIFELRNNLKENVVLKYGFFEFHRISDFVSITIPINMCLSEEYLVALLKIIHFLVTHLNITKFLIKIDGSWTGICRDNIYIYANYRKYKFIIDTLFRNAVVFQWIGDIFHTMMPDFCIVHRRERSTQVYGFFSHLGGMIKSEAVGNYDPENNIKIEAVYNNEKPSGNNIENENEQNSSEHNIKIEWVDNDASEHNIEDKEENNEYKRSVSYLQDDNIIDKKTCEKKIKPNENI